MNWNQTGMPSALVSRLGQKRELSEFRTVLKDAQNHVLQPVDVEPMAEELLKSGGRGFVDMVRELTTALETAKRELEDANRRYERLVADLKRRGIAIEENGRPQWKPEDVREDPSKAVPFGKRKSQEDGLAEWEEWDRRFRALLG